MELVASEVVRVLREKGVEYLYHANTLVTSRTFMREGALLSRGTVEQRGYKQTVQYSDALDKKHGIWFDLFLDSVDIHEQAKRSNHYGPILFVLALDALIAPPSPPMWITKKNPTAWIDGEAVSDRWFQTIEEVQSSFDKNAFGHMLVLRHCGGVLPLKGHLKRIIIDKLPDGILTKQVNVQSYCRGALASASMGGVGGRYDNRVCKPRCLCQSNYSMMPTTDVKKLFSFAG